MVEQDVRLSLNDIASCTGISEGSVQTILKMRLDLRKVCARWVPQLLTEEQKTQRLKCAWELLKTYKGCNSNQPTSCCREAATTRVGCSMVVFCSIQKLLY